MIYLKHLIGTENWEIEENQFGEQSSLYEYTWFVF